MTRLQPAAPTSFEAGPAREALLPNIRFILLSGLPLLGLAGCTGAQSTLDPAGFEASAVARLFWIMLGAAGLIWLLVMSLALYAARRRAQPWSTGTAGRFILMAGAVAPTLLLSILLVFGLRLMPPLRAPGEGLRIAVQGEQFWWRIGYHLPDGGQLDTANELRLPLGRRTELLLTAQDVIHSFWVPNLAGKLDMIPGMTNRLVLQPTRLGHFRGVCAEFCGLSHTLMAFDVIVMPAEDFDAWLAQRQRPRPSAPPAEGERLFLAHGCGACHAVAGTEAAGRIGPDLTALSQRPSLGAGILPNTPATIDRFIREVDQIKPGARMPAFSGLTPAETATIAAWLAAR